MKQRHGFVSNSSSSSFIIALDSMPISQDDFLHMLNLKHPSRCVPDYYEEQDKPSVNDVMFYIMSKMEGEASCNDTLDFIQRKYYREIYEIISDKFDISIDSPLIHERRIWKDWIKGNKIADYYKKTLPDNLKKIGIPIEALDPNKKRFIIELSDNDSAVGSAAEHGTWFKNIPHIRISDH